MLKTGGFQAKGKTSTLKTGKICYNIIYVKVLVLVNVQNCLRTQSPVCRGTS